MESTLNKDLEQAAADFAAKTETEKEEAGKPRSIYNLIEQEIIESDLPLDEKNKKLSRLAKIKYLPLNIMLVGGTGCGKSSTINAMFDMNVAKVGTGVDPETADIQGYQLDNLTVWDTPGLGDSPELDAKYTEEIKKKLSELDKNGGPVIDLVLVIIDASQKDLNTVYDCINDVLIPAMGEDAEKRILICLNQADMAMKGKHWLGDLNCPDTTLSEFLEEKAKAIGKRIADTTGITFKPVYYCAGYTEADGEQLKPYNLSKLLYVILAAVPKEKRLSMADVLNPDQDMWEKDDQKKDYRYEIKKSFWEVVGDHITGGAEKGVEVGVWVLGAPGGVIGAVLGGAVGAIGGFFSALFNG